jgi:hypothetical protein
MEAFKPAAAITISVVGCAVVAAGNLVNATPFISGGRLQRIILA